MSATRFHHVTVAICATEIAVRIVVNAVSHNDNFLIAAGVIFDGIEDILPQEGASHCAIVRKVTLVIHHSNSCYWTFPSRAFQSFGLLA